MQLQAAVSSLISHWPASQIVPPELQPIFLAWADEHSNATGAAYLKKIVERSQKELTEH